MEGMDHTDGWSGDTTGDTTGVTNFQIISGRQFPVVSSASSGDVRGSQQVHSSIAAAFPPGPPP